MEQLKIPVPPIGLTQKYPEIGTGPVPTRLYHDPAFYEKEIEGFGELFCMLSYEKVKSSTMQSRATGGVAGGTYLFALPGSPGACRDGWEEILKWQLDSRFRPCNLVELMPRLQEHLTASG